MISQLAAWRFGQYLLLVLQVKPNGGEMLKLLLEPGSLGNTDSESDS